jgi:TonB family protein
MQSDDGACKVCLAVACLFFFFCGTAFAENANGTCRLPFKVKPIMKSHVIPAYPPESVQNNEEGTVLLRIKLGPDGAPAGVTVLNSSGFSRLDEAARNTVQSKWRWQPPPRDCKDVEFLASVKWDLGVLKDLVKGSFCNASGELNADRGTNVSPQNAETICALMTRGPVYAPMMPVVPYDGQNLTKQLLEDRR